LIAGVIVIQFPHLGSQVGTLFAQGEPHPIDAPSRSIWRSVLRSRHPVAKMIADSTSQDIKVNSNSQQIMQ
jgi:hypothetical protein